MHSSGRIGSRRLRQTLAHSRCSEDVRGERTDISTGEKSHLVSINVAPVSAPLFPPLTRKRVVSHTHQTSALSTSTHIVNYAVIEFKLNPFAQVPHVFGPKAAARPLWNGIIPRDRLR